MANDIKSHSTLYFEISEHHEFEDVSWSQEIIDAYKEKHFRIALDDYGSGYSGLQLLYHSDPDLIKIDRFFIEGILQFLKD
ncbi:MAG: EAL domain-containing protein [Spirochaetia bacterium]